MFEFKESKAANQVFAVVSSLAKHENFYNLSGEYPIKTQFDTGVHTIHTPLKVVREMVESAFNEKQPNENSSILVLFNVEFVFSLVYNFGIEFKQITFFSDHQSKTKLLNSLSDNSTEIIFDKEKLMSKKFDFVFGNPPYNGLAALHQQVFNKAVDLVKDDGYVVFVQPANPYQNKKDKKKKAEKEMIDNVVKYRSKVHIHPGTVFEAAGIMTDVAITTLQKIKSIPVINEITYKNGETFEKVKIEDISITEIDPRIYNSIMKKFTSICKQNGSVSDKLFNDSSESVVYISKVRGHPNNDDFFTIVPKKENRKHYIDNSDTGTGVKIPVEYAENFYDYCETFVARMGLALMKFSQNLTTGGATNLVPMFDFSRTYTDEELYQLVGLTDEEINAIENFLPDYYGRKA